MLGYQHLFTNVKEKNHAGIVIDEIPEELCVPWQHADSPSGGDLLREQIAMASHGAARVPRKAKSDKSTHCFKNKTFKNSIVDS